MHFVLHKWVTLSPSSFVIAKFTRTSPCDSGRWLANHIIQSFLLFHCYFFHLFLIANKQGSKWCNLQLVTHSLQKLVIHLSDKWDGRMLLPFLSSPAREVQLPVWRVKWNTKCQLRSTKNKVQSVRTMFCNFIWDVHPNGSQAMAWH